MNLLTAERRLAAIKEVKTGRAFCLSHPLDRPGGNVLNAARHPPVFHPVMRQGLVYFNLAFDQVDPRFTDIGSDEAVMLYTQYSSHWDGFPHKGSQFDADGDGRSEKVYYNGYRAGVEVVGPDDAPSGFGAKAIGIERLAAAGVQGRAFIAPSDLSDDDHAFLSAIADRLRLTKASDRAQLRRRVQKLLTESSN